MKLRKLTLNDLPFLLSVRNDETTRRFLENDSVFTYEECKEWYNKTNPAWFIIEVEGEDIGYIRTDSKTEVGCDIHPAYRKKGYATSAYKLYLQDKYEAELWVFENNFALEMYKKLGFTPTHEKRDVRGIGYIKMIWKRPTT